MHRFDMRSPGFSLRAAIALLVLFAIASAFQAGVRGVKYTAETLSAGGSEVSLQLADFRALARHVPDDVRAVRMQVRADQQGRLTLRRAQRGFAPRIVLPDGGAEWLIAPADAAVPALYDSVAVSGDYALYRPVGP